MIFGADTDEKKAHTNPDLEWLLGNNDLGYVSKGGGSSSKGKGPRSDQDHLCWHFVTHHNQKMHNLIPNPHWNILRREFGRLLEEGYERSDLMSMVDKFWATRSAIKSPTPALTFCNRAFQRSLLAGSYVRISNEILAWIGNNFERVGDLPWDEAQDTDYKRLIMLEGMDALYSYPEVVADIMTLQEDPTEALQELTVQLHWNWKTVDRQSNCLIELVPTIPAELLKRGKARTKKDSLSEAIAIAQGA